MAEAGKEEEVNRLTFEVHGTVKGQPRTKAFRRGNHAGVYTPPTADAWRAAVRAAAMHHWNKVTFTGPLKMTVSAVFQRPKSHFKANGDLKPSAPAAHCHTSKPDLDNAIKAISDELSTPDPVTGLSIMHGDACIQAIYAEKVWASDGFHGARISISEIAPTTTTTTIADIASQIV